MFNDIMSYLTLISLVLGIVFIFIDRYNAPKPLTKERYEKVVFPLISNLKTILFKKQLEEEDLSHIEQCKAIVDNNPSLAGEEIRYYFDKDLLDKKIWSEARYFLYHDYIHLCVSLGVPVFPWEHERVLKQYGLCVPHWNFLKFLQTHREFITLVVLFLAFCLLFLLYLFRRRLGI